jgi:hypothetical protein
MIRSSFINALKENSLILKQFIESMSDKEIHHKIKNYWTIYDHLEHLVITQIMLLKRLELFIKEENPVIVPFVPEDKPKSAENLKSISGLLEKYAMFRAKQIAVIEKADEHVWEKNARHNEYKKYTFEILVRHIILHDAFHMYRMEELWIRKEQNINELK